MFNSNFCPLIILRLIIKNLNAFDVIGEINVALHVCFLVSVNHLSVAALSPMLANSQILFLASPLKLESANPAVLLRCEGMLQSVGSSYLSCDLLW